MQEESARAERYPQLVGSVHRIKNLMVGLQLS